MTRQQEILGAISANPAALALVQMEQVDTEQVAQLISVGNTKLVPTEIGSGTILAVVGETGGAFIDTLVAISASNRNLFWTMDLIKQGRLRIDIQATRDSMVALAVAVPSVATAIDALLTLGYAPDPFSEFEVRQAIFNDDGSKRI